MVPIAEDEAECLKNEEPMCVLANSSLTSPIRSEAGDANNTPTSESAKMQRRSISTCTKLDEDVTNYSSQDDIWLDYVNFI